MIISLQTRAIQDMDAYLDNTSIYQLDIELAEKICMMETLSPQGLIRLYNKFLKLTKRGN